ncbi:MAG TPA: hypothetical protein VMT45_10810 [Thermoanaerobaculaceae bacterium]|nr:hypothetical protein [Thermoanaerobaculaceae bacterium]
MRAFLVTLGFLLVALASAVAEEPPGPTPPAPAAAAAARFKLDLANLLALPEEGGHAEFNLGLRRESWNDPMVRLAYALGREQASQMRFDVMPWTANDWLLAMPGPGLGQVLAGPFASDWHDLTPQEKIGRISEGVVYWGLFIGILSSIHRP